MIKVKEMSDPNSCLNRSQPEEPLFVLCARDPHAPGAVEYWAYLKAGGKPINFDMPAVSALPSRTAEKVLDAIDSVTNMESWRRQIYKVAGVC